MTTPPPIELTAERQVLVRETLRRLQALSPEIEKLKACGIDCTGYEALKQELHNRFTALAQMFVKQPDMM